MKLSSETEIADFENTIFRKEHVFGFEISMYNVMGMHEVTGFKHLPDYFLGLQMIDSVGTLTLELIKNSAIELLKDQKYSVVFSKHFQ